MGGITGFPVICMEIIMQNILSAENIVKSYNDKPLLDNASFYLHEGEKVGIIGINGTGKSTLLKILAGYEEPDKGKVTSANNMVIRYLPQTPVFDTKESILENIIRQNISKTNTEWEVENEAKTLLTKLGITDFTQKVDTLSGGQKKKAALVSTLVSKADILILDEPTNHLDNEMAGWLEEYLKKFRGALIMVTHDRYFLDSVTGRIVEIDRGKIYSYQANYSGFLELKAEREDVLLAGERKRKSILRNEIEWIRRGARARSTKQKARIERYEELKNSKYTTANDTIEMSSVSSRLGKTTVELHGISKSFGEKVLFENFEYIFLKKDRVGFIGKNGCGKTTLMKIIAGKLNPDTGQVITGQTVKIGYYTQEITQDENEGIAYMNPKLRVIDYIRNTAEYVMTDEGSVSASVMLDRFLFPPEKQYTPIERLSGGEKRRLNLLRVLMEAPNILILDEPTNDLDIQTLTILEDYLDSFDGIVITVSHDRYFLDRTVRRIFAFEGNGVIKQYEGGYSDYVLRKEMESAEISKEENEINVSGGRNMSKHGGGGKNETDDSDTGKLSGKEAYKAEKEAGKKLKFSYKEQKEYETIEGEIAQLEETIAVLESQMLEFSSNFVKLSEITNKLEETKKQLDEKMERWLYLEELADKIASR